MTLRAGRRVGAWFLAGFLLGGGTVLAGEVAGPLMAAVQVERSVYLMGTIATFAADAPDRATGLAQLERMVRIVEATEAELSTWRGDSVLGRLNRHPVGEAMPAPVAVCELLEHLATWRDATAGAFDPVIGSLIDVWDLRGDGRRPDDATLEAARRNAGWDHLAVERSAAAGCAITRNAPVTLDAGAFGKGEAIDRVRRTEGGDADAWMIDFGGQVAVSGAGWPVAIAHPARRNGAALEVTLSEGSLATSGGSERDLTLPDGTRVGHILDPRTGRPAPARQPFSVTVWHERALDADVLSTALYVMGPDDGLAWAEAQGIAACFLIADAAGGVAIRSSAAFEDRF